MSVLWSATALETGRVTAVERCSDFQALANRFHELRSRGQGYIEVRRSDGESPLLTLGFRGDHAVIHQLDDAERCFLLLGDGATSADAVVEVPVMDDLAAFSGTFVLTVDRAWALVGSYLQTGEPEDLGEWSEL